MLQDLTIKIVKFWSCCHLSAGLQETSRAAETSAQVCGRLQEQLRPQHKLRWRHGAIYSHQSFLASHNHKEFCLSYSSLLQSRDLLHHNITSILQVSLYILIRKCRDNGDGRSDWKYIFRRPRGKFISSQYTIYTLDLSQLSPSRTLAELSYIHALCVVHHWRVSIHSLSHSSYAPRDRSAHSHRFPSYGVRGSVECWWWAVCLLAPTFHHTVSEGTWWCTTRPWSSEFGDALPCRDLVNLKAVMEWVLRCT